jgi:hypothetical protein
MMHASNTPPDGDFVRYVERLTGSAAVSAVREDLFVPRDAGPGSTSLAANSGQPSAKAAQTSQEPLHGLSFWTHVKWVVALWIATQALAKGVPAASHLFIPALMVYAVWIIFRVSRHAAISAGKPDVNPLVAPLVERLSELARRAAEKAKTAQQFKPSQPSQHKSKP